MLKDSIVAGIQNCLMIMPSMHGKRQLLMARKRIGEMKPCQGCRIHPVHSLLLALKFPIFGGLGLEPRKLRHVILAEVSSEVVELLVDMVYGMDR